MSKLLLLCISIFGFQAHAVPNKGITFQGVIKANDGSFPTATGLTAKLKVLSTGTQYCVLREETFSGVNVTNGFINLVIGAGTVGGDDPGLSFQKVFDNSSVINSLNCFNSIDDSANLTVTSYTPLASDARKLRLEITLSGNELIADFNLRAMPFALNSETLNGKTDSQFIQTSTNITQSNVENWFSSTAFANILSGTYQAASATTATTATTAGNVTGIVAVANGGTGASTAASARTNLGLGSLAVMTPTGTVNGTKFLRDDGSWQSVAGSVTSVAGRSGDVVLTTSDLADFNTAADARITAQKAQNNGLASLNGTGKILSSQLALSASDIPNLDYAKITSGTPTTVAGYGITDAVKNFGNVTGILSNTFTNRPAASVAGRLFVSTDTQEIYQDTGSAWIKIASVSNTSGTVTSVAAAGTAGNPITVSGTASAPTIDLPAATTSVNGYLTSTDWNTFNGKQNTVGSLGGDLSGTLPNPDVVKLRGNAVAVGTLTAPDAGKVYRWNGTNFVGTFLNFGDLKTVAGSQQLVAACAANEKIQWSVITDSFTCQSIGSLNASTITAGTIDSARLPAATSSADGIMNQIAQSFSGIKTFVNNVIMQGTLSVTGAISSSGNISTSADLSSTNVSASGLVTADRIKIANSSATCNAGAEGSLRYNSTSKKMEFCNGTSWGNISAGTLASLSIGSPSSSLVKSGPVTFDVTYGSGVDTATITLTSGNITLGGTATSGCSISGVSGSGATRTVTINGCTGTGTVNISVAANTASSTTGETAAAAGPSTTYSVDNTGPNAPTGVSLGSVPANLTNSPTITYSAASDVGGSTVANHQVKIIKTSDSSVIRDWANHTSGSDIGSLTLTTNTQYSVLVRAIDALGNNGTQTSATNWTSINDPCLGSPTPGTVCTGGSIYIGSLSPGSTTGSGTNKYMTTPGGCSDIPAGSISGGSGASSYANADFTPASCSGTDSLTKYWNDGTGNWYDLPNLTNYQEGGGTGQGATYTDNKYGSQNAVEIVAITAAGEGGYHAAARYCDKLSYGGYTDWYLPNRYELNLMWTNQASIPGLDISGNWYWSSTEYNANGAWFQRFNDGYQGNLLKTANSRVRCIRRF